MNNMDLKKNKKILIALFGKSGAGKDSILNYLSLTYPEGHKVISYTTRPPRNDSGKGDSNYYFISEAEFFKKINEGGMLEYTQFRDWHYGTPIEQIFDNTINYGVFNINAICQMKHADWLTVIPVQVVADDVVRLKRALDREPHPDCHEICRRFLADEEDYNDIPFGYITLKNNVNQTFPEEEIRALWATVVNIQALDFII